MTRSTIVAGESTGQLDALSLARLVEFTEGEAYAEQLRVAPPEWRCSAERTELGWCLFAPTLDFVLFNRIVGCGLGSPATRSGLHDALARYRAAGLRRFGVQLAPAGEPAELSQWLAEEGLTKGDNWAKVYRGNGVVTEVQTDLRIEPASKRDANAVGTIASDAFAMPVQLAPWIASLVGRPNWYHYLAWDGSTPVAVAALFVHGEVGWLGIAGTLATARRRGAQSALMARRISDGISLGCRWFVTETGEDLPTKPNPSFHNMLRAGFKVAYQRPNYLAS